MEIDHKDEPSNKLRNLFRFFLWHIKRSRQLFFSVRDCYSYYSWGAAAASAAVLVRLLPAANSIAIISQRVKTWWESLTGCVYTRITFLTTSWAWHGRQNLLFLLAVWLLFLSSSIFSLYKAKTSFIIIWRCSSTYLVRRRATITTTTTATAGYSITDTERRRTPTKPTNRTICNKNSLS